MICTILNLDWSLWLILILDQILTFDWVERVFTNLKFFVIIEWIENPHRYKSSNAFKKEFHFSLKTIRIVVWCICLIKTTQLLLVEEIIISKYTMSLDTVPKDLRGLRACLVCSLIKVFFTITLFIFKHRHDIGEIICLIDTHKSCIKIDL